MGGINCFENNKFDSLNRSAGGGAAGAPAAGGNIWNSPPEETSEWNLKLGLEQKQTGMKNMTITHIFEITLRFEREKKAGLGLRRRTLQAFPPARGAPAAPPPAEYSD